MMFSTTLLVLGTLFLLTLVKWWVV
ncbi:MAG: hypothetical protein ACD_50C00261G0001, partial [uncultured bacterium]